MPKLWVLSDLHLETIPHPEAFKPTRPDFDLLVCPGDVWEGDCARGFRFLRRLAGDRGIVFVMGNHEYWNVVVSEEIEVARYMAKAEGITLLECQEATIEGVRFVGATLWTDYRLGGHADPSALTGEQVDVEHDGGSHLLTVGDARKLHAGSRRAIENMLAKPGAAPTVVVTHHAPHIECIPRGTRDTWSAGNCASDLSHLTDSGIASLWVHGHIHKSVDLVRPNGTRIVCNPAGAGFSNDDFEDTLTIEV